MNIKAYLKSHYFIIPLIILLVIAVYNSYCYFDSIYKDYNYYINKYTTIPLNQFMSLYAYNRFTFFKNFFSYNYTKDIFTFLIPSLVIYSGISLTNNKLNGSFFKCSLLRNDYKKMITKELLGSYIKAYLPFFITMTIVLIIGCITLPTNTKYYFDDIGKTMDTFRGVFQNHYIDIALMFLWMFLYCVIEVNFSYIVMYKVKNIYGNIIVTFVIMLGVLYVTANLISQILNPFLFDILDQHLANAISSGFYLVLSSIPLYFLYRNKERVVRNFE